MSLKVSFLSTLLHLVLTVSIYAQHASNLPRSTPEAEGVSSQGIIDFIDAVNDSKHELHSFMLLRHGKVVAEGWWNPYDRKLKHTMYSLSKSFTSTAIGFAVAEKRLTVDDKVVSFFPAYLPDSSSAYLEDLSVKDLLSMSVGQDSDATGSVTANEINWLKSFLALPIANQPGSKFLYNSLATYALSAIVQKVSGQKLIDYLTPRLFKPLAIKDVDWEIDPKGINTGGWGLRLRTEDMAKFGQLYLQKGKWKGKQLLPEAWVEEATTMKILQSPEVSQEERDSSDWLQGYCYQFWRSRHNSYRGDGAFGQFILVLPEQDAVIAITAETSDMQDELNLVWRHLLPALSDGALERDQNREVALKEKLKTLSLRSPAENPTSASSEAIWGKTFQIDSNKNSIKSLSLKFLKNLCYLTITGNTGAYKIGFSETGWHIGSTTRPGPYLLAKAKARFAGLPPFKVAGHYTWKDKNTLELTLRYIESPHTQNISFNFNNDSISVDFSDTVSKNNKETLTGHAKNN